MPMNTGQMFADAEPTVPIVTLSAARAAGAASTAGQSSRAAKTLRNSFIAVLLPRAFRGLATISLWPCRHPIARDNGLQFPSR